MLSPLQLWIFKNSYFQKKKKNLPNHDVDKNMNKRLEKNMSILTKEEGKQVP